LFKNILNIPGYGFFLKKEENDLKIKTVCSNEFAWFCGKIVFSIL
jgi:hypothetical protein